jgi:ribonuclease P protein subunit RPR2
MKPKERIERLLKMAREAELERQRRYVELATRISTRTRTRIPRKLKRQICKGCGALLVPGRTARVRTRKGELRVTCTKCGTVRKIPMDKDSKTY